MRRSLRIPVFFAVLALGPACVWSVEADVGDDCNPDGLFGPKGKCKEGLFCNDSNGWVCQADPPPPSAYPSATAAPPVWDAAVRAGPPGVPLGDDDEEDGG